MTQGPSRVAPEPAFGVPGALLRDGADDVVAATAAPGVPPVRRAAGTPALSVEHVDFRYGTQQVLYDVSLEIEQGEIAALLGTNGAGKSTLLRAVSGLQPPSRGSISLFGETTTRLPAEKVVERGVALLSGGKMTFPSLTVAENLQVGAHPLRNRPAAEVREAVETVYERFPALASRRSQRAGTLSGGEQQQLALGRVLLTAPRLLLIDELTLGLAPRIVEQLLDVVREVNRGGTTVVLVEQSVNLALALAEHAFFLERGQVRFDGRVEELLERDDLLRPVFLGTAATGGAR